MPDLPRDMEMGQFDAQCKNIYETGGKVGKNLTHFPLTSHVLPYKDLNYKA